MLPRERTLTRKLFPRHTDANVLWNGKVLRVRCYVKRSPEVIPRFAVVVSKKQYKTVVERNLFKRRVLSALRAELPSFDRLRFGAYVIFPVVPVTNIVYEDIASDVHALVSRSA